MSHFIEALRLDAEAAVARMQDTAREARRLHARAELMRHMVTTAHKVKDQPRQQAVATVVREWMDAWQLERSDYLDIALEMQTFTEAFYDYANDQSDANDLRIRDCCAALDNAFAGHNTSIADQMAFRSQCAHGWWEWVEPVPADLPGRKPRPTVPGPRAERSFWTIGCADFCR
jgi:ATP-dependent exoDNAse (exonuclease V) beta subunit